jgi:o-succinylbenzoate synthase
MIKSINYKKINVEMLKPFKIALGSTDFYEGYLVEITTDDGIIGYGEAAPVPIITGDSMGSVEYELSLFSKILINHEESPEKLNELMKSYAKSSKASRAAIDMALYDIIGKRANMPLYKMIGNYRDKFATSYTVDLVNPAKAKSQAIDYMKLGIKIFKIKLGSGFDEDYERVKTVRSVVGDNEIYVDFNQSYDPKKAVKLANEIEKFDVSMIEQPVHALDIRGLRYVKNNTSIYVMADESAYTPEDAISLINLDAVDMINIKLMKSGGITDALKIVDIAEAAKIKTMVGCMVETKVANTAALNIALGRRNVDHIDLDGYSSLKFDITDNSMRLEDGINYPSNENGLGFRLNDQYKNF